MRDSPTASPVSARRSTSASLIARAHRAHEEELLGRHARRRPPATRDDYVVVPRYVRTRHGLEVPFPTLPDDVRARARALTGREVETSYRLFLERGGGQDRT